MEVENAWLSLLKNGEKGELERWVKELSKEKLCELDENGLSIMHLAAEKGDVQLMEALCKTGKIDLDVKDKRGGRPFLEAAASGQLECMQWMVANGADFQLSDNRGDTALHLAAGYGHEKIVSWLLNSGAKVDSRTKVSVTPLLYATAKGRLKTVQLLLQHGADPFAIEEERGWNAIHIAAGCNQADSLCFLAKRVPGLFKTTTRGGKTVSEVAIEERCPDAYLACMETAKILDRLEKKRKTKDPSKNVIATVDPLAEERAKELERELLELEDRTKKAASVNKKKKKGTKKNKKQQRKETLSNESQEIRNDEEETVERSIPSITSNQLDDENQPDLLHMDQAEESNPDAGEWVVKRSKRSKKQLLEHHNSSGSGNEKSDNGSTASTSNAATFSEEKELDLPSKELTPTISLNKPERDAEPVKRKPIVTVDMSIITNNAGEINGPLSSPTRRKYENRWTLGSSNSKSKLLDDVNGFVIADLTPKHDSAFPEDSSHASPRSLGGPAEISEQALAYSHSQSQPPLAHSNINAVPDHSISQFTAPGNCSTVAVSSGTTKSRLRPHAPPWSPRRRRWTSQAANAGQVKAKVLVDLPPEVVDNEFQRMLKKFVHMDTGARNTAKRKFAKATADYEEKRLADAEEMEQSWRTSVKSRLRRGIRLFQFSVLQTTLEEIKAAEEARCLHIGKEPESTFLSEDSELAHLVARAHLILQKKDTAPFQHVCNEWRSGVLVLVPDTSPKQGDEIAEDEHDVPPAVDDEDGLHSFEVQLRHSVESWRLKEQYRCVWLRFAIEQAALIPVAARVGFDFEHARPGYVIMKYLFPDEAAKDTPEDQPSLLTLSHQLSVGIILVKRVKSPASGSTSNARVLLERKIENHGLLALPSQLVLSGEDPILVAETLVRERCGYAVSPHLLGGSGTTFFCSVHVDETEEHVFDNQSPDYPNYSWESVSELRNILDSSQFEACTNLFDLS